MKRFLSNLDLRKVRYILLCYVLLYLFIGGV